jgi:hypothetical protein
MIIAAETGQSTGIVFAPGRSCMHHVQDTKQKVGLAPVNVYEAKGVHLDFYKRMSVQNKVFKKNSLEVKFIIFLKKIVL